jgi:hypothetical protein
LWALLGLCVGTAFLAFAYPMYVIRPFCAQGANELAAALLVRRYGPFLAVAAAAGAVFTAILIWRNSRRWFARSAAVAGTALAGLFAALANVNVFEMMFHRIDAPGSVAASEAELEADDMVLSIRVGGHARAYPIRMMGYHHIVNDWVGGVPVAGTY